MKLTYYSSSNEIQKELGARVKDARINMQWTQEELSKQAGVSPKTVSNLETGKDVSFRTVIEILRALGCLQNIDTLLPEQTIRPSELAELGKKRERAPRKKKKKEPTSAEWTWGDEK